MRLLDPEIIQYLQILHKNARNHQAISGKVLTAREIAVRFFVATGQALTGLKDAGFSLEAQAQFMEFLLIASKFDLKTLDRIEGLVKNLKELSQSKKGQWDPSFSHQFSDL